MPFPSNNSASPCSICSLTNYGIVCDLAGDTESSPALRPVGISAVPCGPYIYLIGRATDYTSANNGGCQIIRYTP